MSLLVTLLPVLVIMDLFLICKFPNNEKVAQFSLKLSSLGNVRTNTLKAFTEDEFKQLLES